MGEVKPMRTQLKRGAWVRIFEDPLTRKVLEGEAKLVRQISYDPRSSGGWCGSGELMQTWSG